MDQEERQAVERDIRDRLSKIEGQVRGIQRMLDAQRSCEEIVTQLLAVRTAVGKVAGKVIAHHVDDCLANLPPDKAKSAVGRAVHLLNRVS